MNLSGAKRAVSLALAAVGVFFAAAGIYVGETDDAPGAALLGFLLMIGAFVVAVRISLRRPRRDGEKG